MADITLLNNQAANGSSSSIQPNCNWLTVFAVGTWDGATVTMEISPDDSSWVALTDATFTEDGAANIQIAPNTYLRATVSGVGTTSLDVLANKYNDIGMV